MLQQVSLVRWETLLVQNGMTQVAKDAGLSRESLCRAVSADGNLSLATVLKVARALAYACTSRRHSRKARGR